jgi:hypothetical protein
MAAKGGLCLCESIVFVVDRVFSPGIMDRRGGWQYLLRFRQVKNGVCILHKSMEIC